MEITNTLYWTRLPAEIRLKILEDVVRAAEQDGTCVTPYAAVSSEWQAVIEAVTFRSLNFSPAPIQTRGFATMANRGRRLGLVRHIHMSLMIPEYNCFDCETPPANREVWYDESESLTETDRQGALAAFRLLRDWKLEDGGVSLDITVQSPSDARHHFKDMDVGTPRRATDPALPVIHDPRHGWENGRRVWLPPRHAIFRLFGSVDPWLFDLAVQRTRAVTRLVIRRQTTRRWAPEDLECLLRNCVGLKEFHYEPWMPWTVKSAASIDPGKLPTAHLCVPLYLTASDHLQLDLRYLVKRLRHAAKDLAKLVLFEDSSDAFVAAVSALPITDSVRIAAPEVAHALARSGGKLQKLEHLSAAFLVDAVDFLPAMVYELDSTENRWGSLALLTLTSRRLTPAESAAFINGLFVEGARAAARLPALRLLELWNGKRGGIACVFRYRAQTAVPDAPGEPARASILWRATWRVELQARVIRAWERVAGRRRPCELRVVTEQLDPSAARFHGDAIPLLGFEHDVVEPVSLEQIQRENRYY